MNCNTCRFELSQCLDGRLPSGRRTVVVQHAESCDACGRFWAELQAAQQLTLQLSRPTVGTDFRESLWARIRAGEGTPHAVFSDAVPLLSKLRYALTGAAAAAVALLAVTWSQDGPEPISTPVAQSSVPMIDVEEGGVASGGSPRDPGRGRSMPATARGMERQDESPLISAAQRLTIDLFAVETAKQLEQRYASASAAVQRLEAGAEDDRTVRLALENADELHAFGEVLLDLRDRQRLFFHDSEVQAGLRFAVSMLGQSREQDNRGIETVRTIVAPALRDRRLGSVTRSIMLRPALDQGEEMEVLLHLNRAQPEIFPKLFFILGNDDPALGMLRRGGAFMMDDDCGPSWVAPRSEFEARDGFLRSMRKRGSGSDSIQVQVELKSR